MYAAKEVQVGIAVTRPPCNDDFSTIAIKLIHTLASAIVTRMYLRGSDRSYQGVDIDCLQTMIGHPLALDKEVHRCQPGPYPEHSGSSEHVSGAIDPAKPMKQGSLTSKTLWD